MSIDDTVKQTLKQPFLRGLADSPRLACALIFTIVLLLVLPTPNRPPGQFQQILDSGTLRIATRLGPLIYYRRDEQAAGFDYFLLEALASHLGLNLDIRVYDQLAVLLDQVRLQNADIGAANLTVTPDRAARMTFSIPYFEVTSVLIQHSQAPPIRSLEEITEGQSLVVIKGSSHAELLRELKSENYPNLSWHEEPGTIMFELMQRVENQEIDFAVIDSSIFELERPYFPRLEIAIELDDPQPLAFALSPQADPEFVAAVNDFLNNYRQNGDLAALVEGVFSHNEPFNIAGSLTLRERIDERLPALEPLFREVAGSLDMDWILLAATSYQESHWNPRARSPTGVRGLMMLTQPTARQMGVENRLDAEQSLRAGAEYLQNLHKRLPDRIGEPDRTKLALAAYNIGLGHLEDARVLTQRGGGNPDLWSDVKKFLPNLQRSEYYKNTRFGYARGTEAVTYVDNIFHFYNILESHAWQAEREARQKFFEESLLEEEPENIPYRSILDMPLSPL